MRLKPRLHRHEVRLRGPHAEASSRIASAGRPAREKRMNGRGMRMRRTAAAALLVALAAACSRGDDAGGDGSARMRGRPDCAQETNADARAACLAVDTVRRLEPANGAQVVETAQRGDTICVHTVPQRVAADGEILVLVLAGRVVKVERSDSIGCGG
jgi:hypothetical protein